MTDVLSPASRPSTDPGPGVGRGVSLSAILGALGAAAAVLGLTVGLGLAGWYGADAGRYGETTDAVRVGATAWLLGHGAGLRLDGASLTLMPLLLTLLSALAAHRSGRWAARRSGCADPRAALTAVAVLTATYGVVALLVALLAAHRLAESDLLRAFAGASALMLVAGGSGVVAASGQVGPLTQRLPAWAGPVVKGAVAMVALLVAAGSVLVAGALVLDFGAAATVLSRLHADGAGGLMYTLVGLAFVPNAVLLAGAYLLGPGFMVGTATLVSPSVVMMGPVPAFPLLAALPADGATADWAPWLVGLPVVLAAVAAYLAGRLRPSLRYEAGAGRGLLSGLVAAGAIALLTLLASGSAGPGRMAEVGVAGPEVLLAAVLALGSGGLVGGAAAVWTARRRARQASTTGTGDA